MLIRPKLARHMSHPFHDVEEAEQTYRSHAAELTRFANSLVGPDEANDVVSEALLRALTSRNWPEVQNQRAYLYRSVLNQVNYRHRSAMRRKAREIRAATNPTVEAPEVRPEVWAALTQLSPKQRAVAYLTYMEDLDEMTVSERLGISRGSVRQHLGRARAKLRKLLDQ